MYLQRDFVPFAGELIKTRQGNEDLISDAMDIQKKGIRLFMYKLSPELSDHECLPQYPWERRRPRRLPVAILQISNKSVPYLYRLPLPRPLCRRDGGPRTTAD
jgi:hypothetical protein